MALKSHGWPSLLASALLALPWTAAGQGFLPQGFTAEELLRKHEIGTYVPATAPPPAGTRNPAEYEPMAGVLVCWPLGVPYRLLDSLSDHTKLWMIVSSGQQSACQSGLTNNGVNMANVGYLLTSTDSYWVRDFGPWFVAKTDGRQGIFDFAYNRPRPLDDAVPGFIGSAWGLPVYSSVLIHTGGNYMSGGHGQAMSTNLVYYENDSSQAWVDNQMLQYLGVDDYQVMTDPQASYINHIDCWAKILSPTKVLVLQVPPGHGDYANIEAAASYLTTVPNHYGTNWEVVRVYSSGTEGYTNSLIVNDRVYVPTWNTSNDAAAIQAYQQALPGYKIVGVYSSGWESTDALHCRAMGVTDSAMLWISHFPVAAAQPAGQPVAITSLIRCHPNFALTSHRCLYRFGTSGAFDSLDMSSAGSDSFSASIPGAAAGDTVEYYLSASDNSGRVERQPRFAPATWCHRYVAEAAGVAAGGILSPVPVADCFAAAAPNPFASATRIEYRLAAAGPVRLSVYNIAGQLVRTLVDGGRPAGRHDAAWDGRDDSGRRCGAGIYLCRLRTARACPVLRLQLVK